MAQIFTHADVQMHNTKNDLYMIINGKVYDATAFVDEHPGGFDPLLEVAGQDATEAYIAVDHSEEADEILSDFLIGTISEEKVEVEKADSVLDEKTSFEVSTIELEPEVIIGIEPPVAVIPDASAIEEVEPVVSDEPVLKPDVFQEFPLEQKTIISHNVAIYRFTLPAPTSIFGLPIGQHISIGALLPQPDGSRKEIVRSYTPISGDHQRGFFDLLVKTYPQGNITQHLAGLSLGDSIRVRGPKGAFKYTPNMVRHFGMIAGGTGITPMLQIIHAIRRGRATGDATEVDLIFANVDEKDILLREELDELVRVDERIRVHYVLNTPPEGWTGGVGFVTEEMISKWLPKPADDVKILLCGPPPMVGGMKKITEGLGFEKARPVSKLEDQVFAF